MAFNYFFNGWDTIIYLFIFDLGIAFGQSSSVNSAKNFISAFSSSKSSKSHKAPRPQRTQQIFDCISKGLRYLHIFYSMYCFKFCSPLLNELFIYRDSIHLAQNDISTSRMAFDSVSVSSVMVSIYFVFLPSFQKWSP